MARLIWTESAVADLRRLRRFLATEDTATAGRAIKAIRTGLRRLEANPRIGRRLEDVPEESREWIIPFGRRGYIVLYRVRDREIVMAALRLAGEEDYREPGA